MAGRPLALTPQAPRLGGHGRTRALRRVRNRAADPEHFCDCCGRQLSVAERTTVEANPVSAAPVVEASPRTALRGPCESCGGPSSDGPLCESCQSAFHLVIGGSTSALLTPEITHDVEQFAPVTADSPPAPSAPQSTSTEAEMLAPAGGESAGASVNTDWSAMNAVETDPAEAVASETAVALTASEVARFAAIEAPTYEPDAVETEPAHAETRRTTAAVADSATSEAGHADRATGRNGGSGNCIVARARICKGRNCVR